MTRSNPLSEYFGYGSKIRLRLGVKCPTDAELIDLWESVRDRFIHNWITKHPGTRPFMWWKCDAPELRRRLDGVHPFDDAEYIAEAEEIKRKHPDGLDLMATTNGLPRYSNARWCGEYETQEDYLRRLGLLCEAEEVAV